MDLYPELAAIRAGHEWDDSLLNHVLTLREAQHGDSSVPYQWPIITVSLFILRETGIATITAIQHYRAKFP